MTDTETQTAEETTDATTDGEETTAGDANEGDEGTEAGEDKEELEPLPRIRKHTRQLRVDLTDDELISAGQEMADAEQSIGVFEKEAKSYAQNFSSKINTAKAVRSEKSQLLTNKYELRSVECLETIDFEKGVAATVRTDTGEELSTRNLSEDEKQRELAL